MEDVHSKWNCKGCGRSEEPKMNDGGPAYPQSRDSWIGTDFVPSGITVWDYYAAHALAASVGQMPLSKATRAAEIADDMMAERTKRGIS